MKQTKYFCNLCSEEKQRNDLMCFHWDSTVKNSSNGFGKYVLKPSLDLSDKHICVSCFGVVSDFIEKNKGVKDEIKKTEAI